MAGLSRVNSSSSEGCSQFITYTQAPPMGRCSIYPGKHSVLLLGSPSITSLMLAMLTVAGRKDWSGILLES